MGVLAAELMRAIHGADIYAGFVPTFAADLQGWNSEHPIFESAIRQERPSVVIDVGAWKGASTIHLAELMRREEINGVVIAVDTFLGSPEHCDVTTNLFSLVPRRHGMPLLYDQFLANVVRAGHQGRIVPLPQTTTGAAIILERLGVRSSLIHIDAAHDYDSVLHDARIYWRLLEPGGYLVGDDYHPYWGSVVRAADQFAREVGCPLIPDNPKWIIRKPRM